MNKAISGLSLVAAAFSLAAVSAPASAACTTDTAGQWECLEIETAAGSGVYTDVTGTGYNGPLDFKGQATLQHWAVGTMSCLLHAQGEARVTAGGTADIRVTGLTSTGGGSCGSVTFGNLPLLYSIGGANDVYTKDTGYTSGTSSNSLEVWHSAVSWFPICTSAITLEFGNDTPTRTNKNEPSYFKFDQVINGYLGDCTVVGTLTTSGSALGENWAYPDVNAW